MAETIRLQSTDEVVADPAIAEALERLARLSDERTLTTAGGTRNSTLEQLAVDLFRSVDNVLKALAKAALASSYAAGRIVTRAGRTFFERAEASIVGEAGRWGDRTGPLAGKLLKRSAIAIAATYGLTAVGSASLTFIPKMFSWVVEILNLLK